MTWAGSTYDHPIDRSIVVGMGAPECAEFARCKLALYFSQDSRTAIFAGPFLYRTTFPDAADDLHSYKASVMQDRIGEFRQLVGYVCLLWLAVAGVVIGLTYAVRFGYQWYWRGTQR
ncbi:hypothetical protein [Caballeronia sp. dw_19]|uniref:hypothetical protein n=1 Tax=Caballeronia sp. dw_19 TaxID=2719791 RepID=UPI001BD2BF70|nr:hypothetical protein [Caballeronia sp. dw_19]